MKPGLAPGFLFRSGKRQQKRDEETGKDDEPDPVVRLEEEQALVGIVDVEPGDLPGEHAAGNKKAELRDRPGARHQESKHHQNERQAVKANQPLARAVAEQACGGADTDQLVVLLVLMRIDRVVADRPDD